MRPVIMGIVFSVAFGFMAAFSPREPNWTTLGFSGLEAVLLTAFFFVGMWIGLLQDAIATLAKAHDKLVDRVFGKPD